jgi:hypothetical protein
VRIDIYVDPKDFEWLSCELMNSDDFPKIGQPSQVLDKVTIEYTNIINEVAKASQRIILIVQFENVENSGVHEFAVWFCGVLQGARVRSLCIERKPVQLNIDEIVHKIMEWHSGRSIIWE